MDIQVRPELESDHKAISQLIQKAFEILPYSDHSEHQLVERIRSSDAYVNNLALVAVFEQQVVGFVLFSEITIEAGNFKYDALALAPIAVLPKYQKLGIGSKLILDNHKEALNLGYKAVALVGHADYYPRFGYKPSNIFWNFFSI